jgi:DNA-binding LytR/AlgR family response regulator
MGVGIATMHYLGMMALHASLGMTHEPWIVAASVVIAIAASGLALHLANGATGRPPLLLSATALGIAIAGMHYTAMAAVTVVPGGHAGHAPITAPAISADLLAIVVAIVAFIVSGLFLLILVPDRQSATAGRREPTPAAGIPAIAAAAAAPTEEPPPLAAAPGDTDGLEDGAAWLPVLHEGATIQLPMDSIVAVQANAHYTYVFDGADRYFCQLAIGDVEQRLDPHRFARVHRSHIINVERIVKLKKTGDNGLIELSGREAYIVPVSRSRIAWVRSHLGQTKPRPPATVAG